ncbi:hypothetical protein CHLRE_06g297516v5 [Chlamydomonas reinhardtii]|uniref:Uncharacterized protein n=1 Tax=Chlamydomonas reinhardtii TaxID=3055 RepID=A0A2K3DQQ0_CHLRE|nr:uncharacterized protein CHLRE_06g297516v5 [Chlamydomonas reinhardtii]PNW82863.1 hypothetical protein CHLRE_06g297516v5 [Chlamydomonas reinhardtii]
MLSKPIHERDVNYIFGAALAASAGGHAHVLAWLEGQVGGDGQWGRPPPSPDWRAGMLAVEAAKAGHIGLLDLLAPRVQPRNRRERYEGHKVLVAIAYGCPLAVLQRYYCQGSHSGGGGAEGGAGGGGTGGEGGSWTGEGPLRGTRARELLSSALASPLADWRQKVQWLLAQCEGCPTAALTALTAPPPPQSRPPITPFEVCGKALVTAPEDASDGANGGKGDGFAARLAAVRALGMTLVFSKGLTPDTWSVWSRNPVQLVLHMLPDTQDAQLRERLLATAAAQRCLPVLQWFQAHEGPGVFTEGHARSALTGLSWSPVHLVHDDDNLLAVLRFFEAVGVLPQPPATAAAAEAEAEAAGDAAAGAAAGGSSQHSAKALAAADVVAAEGAAAGAAGEAVDAAAALRQQWSEALRESVLFGTGLPVLRYLRERCGVHLGVRGLAVAGCSLEALTWALANSPCASGNAEFSVRTIWGMCALNPPAAAWLCEHGFAQPPTVEQALELLLKPPHVGGSFAHLQTWLRLVQRSAERATGATAAFVDAQFIAMLGAQELLVKLLEATKWDVLQHQREWLRRLGEGMAGIANGEQEEQQEEDQAEEQEQAEAQAEGEVEGQADGQAERQAEGEVA